MLRTCSVYDKPTTIYSSYARDILRAIINLLYLIIPGIYHTYHLKLIRYATDMPMEFRIGPFVSLSSLVPSLGSRRLLIPARPLDHDFLV